MASRPTSADTLRQRIDEIRWFHSIELAPGVVTPGVDDTIERSKLVALPADLSGRTVLDIGAWDGAYSFEAERRGAERVVAADSFAWNGSNWSDKRGFELARSALGSQVEDVDVDVMDLDPAAIGEFDVVLFLGVLYHLRHPLLALERVASVTGEMLILETHVDMTWTTRPSAAFYPSHELEFDPTNWWGPNPEALVGMLNAVGFSRVEIITSWTVPHKVSRSLKKLPRYLAHLARHRARPAHHPSQGRIVVHAYQN
jgi:tRNA (mo5U34)-methyltransferase